MIQYRRNSRTISGRLLDEMVMMDMDQGKYFALNQTATSIWELLETPRSTEELCSILSEQYEVEAGQCAEEVEEHLCEMLKLGLLVRVEPD